MHDLNRSVAALAAGSLFLLGAVLVDFVGDLQLSGVYATAAILAAVSGRSRATAAMAGLAVAAAFISGVWHGTVGDSAWAIRLASCVVAGLAAVIAAQVAEHYSRTMRHTTRLAQDLLDALAVELTGARTVVEVADAFLGKAAMRLGAASAMVFLLDENDVMRSVSWLGRGGSQADQYAEFPLSADLPGAAAARSRTPLHFPDRAAIEAAFPGLAGYYPEERSLHVLPLAHEDRLLGLLALTFKPTVVGTDDERGLLVSLSAALSTALARAETLMASDAEVRRTALLAEASRVLSRSLDWDETLAEVSRLLVPELADWCSLLLLRDGKLETVAVWHRDPDTSAWAQTMIGVFPIDMAAPTGAPAVVRSGRPELYPSIPEELIAGAAVNEEHETLLRRLGLVSAMIAPMTVDGAVTGAVSLAYAESDRRYTEQDVQLLTDLASRIGTALGNAESFTQQSRRLTEVTRVAAAAQQAILSPPPPQLGPLQVAARYVSAAEEAQVGGDLYEVIAREDRVRVLIGDVRGKGLSAVRAATVVLGGFRSVAIQDLPVEEVARQLDTHFRAYVEDDEDFVTAALVDIEHDGRFRLVLCGHPAPLVTYDGGWRRADAEPAAPLGLGSAPVPTEGVLTPGDRMILFTDGLLEARRPDGTFLQPEELWSLAGSRPFADVLDGLLNAVQSWTGGPLQDDLALLSIQYLERVAAVDGMPAEPAGPPARMARVLPAEGASVGIARHMVRTLLDGTTLAEVADDAQTAVSELVTNALVHAGSEIHLAVSLTGSGLRVEVGDTSPHLPVQRDYAATSATGRGLRIVGSVTTRWGSFRLGRGKVVWFEIADPAGEPFSDLLDGEPGSEGGAENAVDITLLNVPLLMHAAWQEQTAALLREYLLVRMDEDPAALDLHAAASDALSLLHEQVPAPNLGDDPAALMNEALEPHVTRTELTLRIRRDSVGNFAVLRDLTEEAIEVAVEGRMFVAPTQPEIRDLCRWICREVIEQAWEGSAPRPWRQPEPARVSENIEGTVAGFDTEQLASSPDALLATNDASVIVAVSPSVVDFLGYETSDDLVGRPVVCLVPRRYQQAHIAGTTLHSVNGRDVLLDVPITVPVVRGDGEEVPVELTVVSRPLPTGRRIFVAEFGIGPARVD